MPDRGFDEGSTVERFIRDLLAPTWTPVDSVDLSRPETDLFVLDRLKAALARLNPEIATQPDRAEDVLHRLRAIVLGVRTDGLVKANEEFAAWLNGERSMPFGPGGEHVTVRLVDFDDLTNNDFVVTTQFRFLVGEETRIPDLVLLVNGMPLVVIEAKTPTRACVSWVDGALQVHGYEADLPELFVSNVCSVATEGKEFRYGSIRMPIELWGPWRVDGDENLTPLERVGAAASSMLTPGTVLDLLANFTTFANDSKRRRIKIVARYQQYEGANRIVERVLAGQSRKGLIWHFQGSGKSLLMLFAARKLRLHPQLGNPTVMIVVDRIDLDTQIASTFYAADAPNLVKADSRADLERLLGQDVRKIIITTIFKFGEAEGVLNDRDNIILLVDEAHRTQEGDLGRKMRDALPNAFMFGLTGTPINRSDRNTFYAFGSDEDTNGYMSRYGFEESIRDGATKELHFEPRLLDLHIDREAIDAGFEELTGHLTAADRDRLSKAAAKMAVLAKAPERMARICVDIAAHYLDKVDPNGFGAQVVAYDRESCVRYKEELDKHLPAGVSEIVMTVNSGETDYDQWKRSRDEEEALLERFRDPGDPLKILIVTAKLLTGFDAPILQTMYLDKPMRDHTLLQAICRTNRPYGEEKTHGLIVDYIGVFDDVAQAIQLDEEGITKVVSNIAALIDQLPEAMATCLAYFDGLDRTVSGYEGLIAAQERLPDNETRDRFGTDFSFLSRLWEAISPDPALGAYETDYRWLSQVYESVKPSTGSGRLIWHALGPKTISLIHENIHVDEISDDLETLVLDADLLEAVLGSPDPKKKAKEIEITIARRLRTRLGDPRFKELGERLEALKEKHEQGLLLSVDFLRELLDLAQDVVAAEQSTPPMDSAEQGKAALTELFDEARNDNTEVIVERIVADIDEIVRFVRFDGWQNTHAGEREVKKALRSTLFKYRLHQDADLFNRSYGYIRQYY